MRLSLGVIAVAMAAALAPLPPEIIERWYSRGFYPPWQYVVTGVTNLVPFALFDIAIALAVGTVLWRVRRRFRGSRGRRLRAAARALLDALSLAAAVYIVFLVAWGLNYRRVLVRNTASFRQDHVTSDALARLAEGVARDASLAARDRSSYRPPDMQLLLERVREARDALTGRASAGRFTPGIPKRSALEPYFRWAGIDGMTDPFLLETLLNPDLLAIERPFTVAHEWAHLAGYAHEAEASLIAWRACLAADAPARYSAWLAVIPYVMHELPGEERRSFGRALAPEVWRDLRAIAARAARASPLVQRSAEKVYDTYLKANRVPSGVASYGEVVTLILGTEH